MAEDYKSRADYIARNKKNNKRKWPWFLLAILLIVGLIVGKLYMDIQQAVESIHEVKPENQIVMRTESVNIGQIETENLEPFSVLLLGVDTGALGRIEQGRSDVVIIATVNPSNNRTTLTSIPRDSLVDIVGHNTQDKINHAYAFGGVAMTVNTVQELLDVPVDYTVSVNMGGLVDIVDAVGGVTVTSPLTFSNEGYDFYEGQSVLMDGEMVLAYTRDRFNEDGDYGRQDRQRQVISTLLKSALSLDNILNYQDLLETLSGNVQTDLTFSQMTILFKNYLKALGEIESFQLSGNGQMIDGVYYEVLDETSLDSIRQMLKVELEI